MSVLLINFHIHRLYSESCKFLKLTVPPDYKFVSQNFVNVRHVRIVDVLVTISLK